MHNIFPLPDNCNSISCCTAELFMNIARFYNITSHYQFHQQLYAGQTNIMRGGIVRLRYY